MPLEYQVWATPIGKDNPVFFGAYSPARWQWAEKQAAFLEDKGLADVEVREVEIDEQEG